ncbi:MAG: hypothetical protein H7Y32_10240 [Chloroflexales bacterium]|nr:hypothetical protein [Chloroflexales bacterium]
MADDFFAYQRRRLGVLLAWGVGSMVAGPLALLGRNAFWRQFGIQTFSWGAIDALLAFFGRRGARTKAERRAQGLLTTADELREARSFRTILLLNAGLDVLYIAGGAVLAWRQWAQRDRRGMGLGIIPQGVFLLLYDSLLAHEVGQRFLAQSAKR